IAACGEFQIVAYAPGHQGTGYVHLRGLYSRFVSQVGSRCTFVFADDGGGKAYAFAEFGGIAVHEAPAKQAEQRSARRRAELFLANEAEILCDPVVPTQRANHSVSGGNIFTGAEALRFIDPSAICVQNASALWSDMTNGTVHIPQADHRGQGVCRFQRAGIEHRENNKSAFHRGPPAAVSVPSLPVNSMCS